MVANRSTIDQEMIEPADPSQGSRHCQMGRPPNIQARDFINRRRAYANGRGRANDLRQEFFSSSGRQRLGIPHSRNDSSPRRQPHRRGDNRASDWADPGFVDSNETQKPIAPERLLQIKRRNNQRRHDGYTRPRFRVRAYRRSLIRADLPVSARR